MGMDCQDNSLIPVMMDANPASEALLKMIYCNCSTGCSSLRYSCRKQGLNSSQARGRCQENNCDNVSERIASDDETEDKTEIRAYLSIYSQLRLRGLQVNRADSLIRPLLSGPDYLSHIHRS